MQRITDYCSVTELAEKWGISRQRVIKLVTEGRIAGAQKVGTSYIIPINAPDPRKLKHCRNINEKD